MYQCLTSKPGIIFYRRQHNSLRLIPSGVTEKKEKRKLRFFFLAEKEKEPQRVAIFICKLAWTGLKLLKFSTRRAKKSQTKKCLPR